jgi:hypothetical protein
MEAQVPPISSDPDLDGVRGLFCAEGLDVVASFLAARGWEMTDGRPVQALYRPTRSLVVRYRVVASDETGRRRVTTICAESRREWLDPLTPSHDFEARFGLADPVDRLGPYLVWAFPYDPGLKGLAEAAWGGSVRDALSSFATRPRAVYAQPLRYRPRRRAVFRYWSYYGRGHDNPTRIHFAKVLRTHKAKRSVEIGEMLSPRRWRRRRLVLSLPSGTVGANTLIFEPVTGRSLRDVLVRGGPLPSPERLARLVDELGELDDASLSGRQERSPVHVARATKELLTRLVPASQAAVATVVDAVERGVAEDSTAPRVTHGDLYEAQVFVNDDFSLGLIDLDDVGPGDPALDAANLCGHLLALAYTAPSTRPRLLAYRALSRRAFLDSLGISPEAFAWREALTMLQLATGPFRVLNPNWPDQVARRIRLAARLVSEPERVERSASHQSGR